MEKLASDQTLIGGESQGQRPAFPKHLYRQGKGSRSVRQQIKTEI
jgi:hypothetical protein